VNETTCAHASKIKNGILRNGQPSGNAVNSFIDHGKFEAMKMLSGHISRASCCVEHQFHAKVFVQFLSYHCLNELVIMKKEKGMR